MDENIGKRFGKLTIIEPAHVDKKSKYYICKCDCGNYKTIRLDNLKYRKTTSCGCLKYEKHISAGKKFGCLTVTRITEEKSSDGSFLYECRCTCGKTVKTTAFKLRSGEIKTCGSSEHLIENLKGKNLDYSLLLSSLILIIEKHIGFVNVTVEILRKSGLII